LKCLVAAVLTALGEKATYLEYFLFIILLCLDLFVNYI
jgi:hypothetical protein